MNAHLRDTQEDHKRKRFQNEVDSQRVNQIMHQEKLNSDKDQHDLWAAQESREIEFTNNHDFMTENPLTEVSMLGDHRVKPYHFKGFK
jgi:hypothetical protein